MARILGQAAQRHGVKVYQQANAGNHLHLLVKPGTQKGLGDFLRAMGGSIARQITGARRAHGVGKFWDAPVFTRLVTWGREFVMVQAYLRKNRVEAAGFKGARLKIRDGETVVVVGDEALWKEYQRAGPL